MWRIVTTDSDDYASLLMRVTLAAVIFPHGAQKALGWFGGYGFDGTLNFFGSLGIPWIVGLLIILAESAGSLLLAVGLLTRVASLALGGIMIGAVGMVHWSNGFFMNWSGAQAGEGFEFHLLALGLAAALVIRGGGAWSLDGLLASPRLREATA